MLVCATCGRRLDPVECSQRVCPSCTWHAALRERRPASARTASSDNAVAMATRLHEFSRILGERLNVGYVEVLEAVARGNFRVYESEVTRLANRYVERLEDTWEC